MSDQPTKVTFARSFTVDFCENCSDVHIDLLDPKGKPFARASFSPDNLPTMAARLLEFHHHYLLKRDGKVTRQ